MNHIIISNCTNRKSSRFEKIKPLPSMYEIDTADQFLEEWFELLNSSHQKNSALNIYQGRSVTEIVRAKNHINAQIIFLSAGLGVVKENDLIPNYDLTISKGTYSLKHLFSKWSIDESIWFQKLINKTQDKNFIENYDGLILIALPHSYLKMIIPILTQLSDHQIKNIRLFLHPISYKSLPENLKHCYMPYNYKFDSSPFSGTKIDYCQRCLHHFIKHIYQPGQDLLSAIYSVNEFISSLAPLPSRIKRTQVSDKEIIEIILEGWTVCQGQSSKLLRYIRDNKKVACEQSRFQALWRSIKDGKRYEFK